MQLRIFDPEGILGAGFGPRQVEGRRRRCGQRQFVVDGVVGVADRRPDHPAIGGDLFLVHRVTEIRPRQEAAELGFRIVHEGREQQFALVGHQHRAVVRNEGREDGDQGRGP